MEATREWNEGKEGIICRGKNRTEKLYVEQEELDKS